MVILTAPFPTLFLHNEKISPSCNQRPPQYLPDKQVHLIWMLKYTQCHKASYVVKAHMFPYRYKTHIYLSVGNFIVKKLKTSCPEWFTKPNACLTGLHSDFIKAQPEFNRTWSMSQSVSHFWYLSGKFLHKPSAIIIQYRALQSTVSIYIYTSVQFIPY